MCIDLLKYIFEMKTHEFDALRRMRNDTCKHEM